MNMLINVYLNCNKYIVGYPCLNFGESCCFLTPSLLKYGIHVCLYPFPLHFPLSTGGIIFLQWNHCIYIFLFIASICQNPLFPHSWSSFPTAAVRACFCMLMLLLVAENNALLAKASGHSQWFHMC